MMMKMNNEQADNEKENDDDDDDLETSRLRRYMASLLQAGWHDPSASIITEMVYQYGHNHHIFTS